MHLVLPGGYQLNHLSIETPRYGYPATRLPLDCFKTVNNQYQEVTKDGKYEHTDRYYVALSTNLIKLWCEVTVMPIEDTISSL
jgi:hypothetical protein